MRTSSTSWSRREVSETTPKRKCQCGHAVASSKALYCPMCGVALPELVQEVAALDLIPDRIGEAVGYRAWEIIGDEVMPRLMSVTHARDSVGGIWPADRYFYAECDYGKNTYGDSLVCGNAKASGVADVRVPHQDCGCGLYSAKSLKQLQGLQYSAYQDGVANKVIGQVLLSGKVIEGTQGWRAQRGRVGKLWVPYERWQFVEPLANAYKVPVGLGAWHDGRIQLDEEAMFEPEFVRPGAIEEVK